jgi:hypothetical protein
VEPIEHGFCLEEASAMFRALAIQQSLRNMAFLNESDQVG